MVGQREGQNKANAASAAAADAIRKNSSITQDAARQKGELVATRREEEARSKAEAAAKAAAEGTTPTAAHLDEEAIDKSKERRGIE